MEPAAENDSAAAGGANAPVLALGAGSGESASPPSPPPQTARQLALRLLRLLCRASLAVLDGGNLVQLLLFLHGRSRHATLIQRLLGFTLGNQRPPLAMPGASGGAAAPAAPSSVGATRGASGAAGDSFSAAGGLQHILSRALSLAEAPLQHARQLLLLSVFSFRLLEWWHAPQHAAPPPPRLIPPPPPPPPPLSSASPFYRVCAQLAVCRHASPQRRHRATSIASPAQRRRSRAMGAALRAASQCASMTCGDCMRHPLRRAALSGSSC